MIKKANAASANILNPLIKAIKCYDNSDSVQLLIKNAIAAVYEKSESQVDEEEISAVICLVESIEPKDAIEVILAAQIICAHLYGMNAMSKNYLNSKGHALMFLRLSHQALEQLQRYRGKMSQNINVSYNTLIKGQDAENER